MAWKTILSNVKTQPADCNVVALRTPSLDDLADAICKAQSEVVIWEGAHCRLNLDYETELNAIEKELAEARLALAARQKTLNERLAALGIAAVSK
ncbi:MAG: hypothetical protein ACRCXM_02595 [Beijerinckiaceae bacterium]